MWQVGREAYTGNEVIRRRLCSDRGKEHRYLESLNLAESRESARGFTGNPIRNPKGS
jgi:hypothetical protein